jgi:hypothetical protein
VKRKGPNRSIHLYGWYQSSRTVFNFRPLILFQRTFICLVDYTSGPKANKKREGPNGSIPELECQAKPH